MVQGQTSSRVIYTTYINHNTSDPFCCGASDVYANVGCQETYLFLDGNCYGLTSDCGSIGYRGTVNPNVITLYADGNCAESAGLGTLSIIRDSETPRGTLYRRCFVALYREGDAGVDRYSLNKEQGPGLNLLLRLEPRFALIFSL